MSEPLPPDKLPPGFQPGLELVIAKNGAIDVFIHDQATRDFYTVLAAREGLDLDTYMKRWLKRVQKDIRRGRPPKQPHE